MSFDPRCFILEMLPKRAVCAEVGVHRGDFSSTILDVAQPRELHLIDPWKHETAAIYKDAWYGGGATGGQQEMDLRYGYVCRRFASQIRKGIVRVHRDRSRTALAHFPDRFFDWVYIDGNHRYEFVKEDLSMSFMRTRDGGYISGDDYGTGGWWEGGVQTAVDEFINIYPVKVITIRAHQFVLQKESG